MTPLKLIYDITFQVTSSTRSGIYRVADELFTRLAQHPQIEIHPCVCTSKGNAANYLHSCGLSRLIDKTLIFPQFHHSCKTERPLSVFRDRLDRLLFQNRYNLLLQNYHCYFSPFLPIPPAVYSSSIPTALFIHDLLPLVRPQFSDPAFNQRYRGWIDNAQPSLAYFNSQCSLRDFLACRRNTPLTQTIVTPLAAGREFYPVSDAQLLKSVRENCGITAPAYFLGLSAESPRKNFLHLSRAFISFRQQNPGADVSLVLAGPDTDKLRTELSNLPEFAEHSSHITLCGYIDDKDLAALYSGALAFVYPSLYEGFGLPILEAMQCGTPVICANNSSLPEVGGEAALYINGTDEQQTTEALAQIYHNPVLRSRLSALSLQRARCFSWNKCVSDIIRNLTALARN